MTNIVLVHGASHGGWCWQTLLKLIDRNKINVFTPTLTGMGERVHLLTSAVTMQTHIDDIANLIHYENLTDVILVGHSYGGLVIGGAHAVVAKRIKKLVFLDSFLPEDGKSGYDILEPKHARGLRALAQNEGNGWFQPVTEQKIDLWGVKDPKIKAYLMARITPFPLNTFNTPIYLDETFATVDKTYIRCTKHSFLADMMMPYYRKAKSAGWHIFEINSDHESMVTAPKELWDVLQKIIS